MDIEQCQFSVKVEASYFTNFKDTPLEEAKRKTIALAEFAKSIGLVITMESTVLVVRYPKVKK